MESLLANNDGLINLSLLDLSGNNLEGFPSAFDLGGLILNVSDNYLDFSDLESLLGRVAAMLTLGPQKKKRLQPIEVMEASPIVPFPGDKAYLLRLALVLVLDLLG